MRVIGKSYLGLSLITRDGVVGKVRDIYFDEKWKINSFVVRVGWPVIGREFLVAPPMVAMVDFDVKHLVLNMTYSELQKCPEPDMSMIISRRYDVTNNIYYGWPQYWDGHIGWGLGDLPITQADISSQGSTDNESAVSDITGQKILNLRSMRDLAGYDIGTDGDMNGRFRDLLINDRDFRIVGLIAAVPRDGSPHFLGLTMARKLVLVPAEWIKDINWREHEFIVDAQKSVARLPEFDLDFAGNRDESGLRYDYRGEPRFWSTDEDSEHKAG